MTKQNLVPISISHTDAEELMTQRDVVIADIRDKESYDKEHITKAIHLSIPALRKYAEEADKSRPILVYCNRGISSQAAGQQLIDLGFQEVYSLSGGFATWRTHHSASDANK